MLLLLLLLTLSQNPGDIDNRPLLVAGLQLQATSWIIWSQCSSCVWSARKQAQPAPQPCRQVPGDANGGSSSDSAMCIGICCMYFALDMLGRVQMAHSSAVDSTAQCTAQWCSSGVPAALEPVILVKFGHRYCIQLHFTASLVVAIGCGAWRTYTSTVYTINTCRWSNHLCHCGCVRQACAQ